VSRPLSLGPNGGGGAASKPNDGPPSSATHPYTFGNYRALPYPDFVKPPVSAALRLLHRLAADPGILGIMAKHRWGGAG